MTVTDATILLPDPSSLGWEGRRLLRETTANAIRDVRNDDRDVAVDILPAGE